MKQNITVNDKTYEVEIGDLMASPVQVMVNGKKFEVLVETTTIEPVASKAATPAAAAPKPVVVARPRPSIAQTVADTGNEIRAPMPGTILDVTVKVGDRIAVGQEVCSLEAMKMKNAIRSSKDGQVAGIDVTIGQRVNFGDVLIRIEA